MTGVQTYALPIYPPACGHILVWAMNHMVTDLREWRALAEPMSMEFFLRFACGATPAAVPFYNCYDEICRFGDSLQTILNELK